jgi:hypothetical protein
MRKLIKKAILILTGTYLIGYLLHFIIDKGLSHQQNLQNIIVCGMIFTILM